MSAPNPIPLSVPDAIHRLLNSAEVLEAMIENRTPESREMAQAEARWAKQQAAFQARREVHNG